MTRKGSSEHPSLERLADFAANRLTEDEAVRVASHLERCPACHLEVTRLGRFATIDSDDVLLEKAEWSRARIELDKIYQEKIRPALSAEEGRKPGILGLRGALRWLVPAAATAAAIVLLLVYMPHGPEPGFDITGQDALRGGDGEAMDIVLESPIGKVTGCPDAFVWSSAADYDGFTLQLFEPDLTPVFNRERIVGHRFDLPGSLRVRLAPGQVYLWSIQGDRGAEPSAVSTTEWFEIRPDSPDPSPPDR